MAWAREPACVPALQHDSAACSLPDAEASHPLPAVPAGRQERARLEQLFKRRPWPPQRQDHHAAFIAMLEEASAALERALQVPRCRRPAGASSACCTVTGVVAEGGGHACMHAGADVAVKICCSLDFLATPPAAVAAGCGWGGWPTRQQQRRHRGRPLGQQQGLRSGRQPGRAALVSSQTAWVATDTSQSMPEQIPHPALSHA